MLNSPLRAQVPAQTHHHADVDEEAVVSTDAAQPILVLGYHDIVPTSVDDPNSGSDTKVDDFQEQMDLLMTEGYKTISADEYYLHRTKDAPVPNKAVLITFDDGYIGDYKLAYPILKSMNLKATFFVHTKYVGVSTTKEHMSWDQLRELDRNPLFKVYSHTWSHPRLPDLSPEEITKEFKTSQEDIIKNLGGPRSYLAYPYGAYDSKVIQIAKQYFLMAFALDVPGGAVGPDRMYKWDRIGINREVSTIDDFRNRVSFFLKDAK